jgi:predicted amidophosphoribosyltransferase
MKCKNCGRRIEGEYCECCGAYVEQEKEDD